MTHPGRISRGVELLGFKRMKLYEVFCWKRKLNTTSISRFEITKKLLRMAVKRKHKNFFPTMSPVIYL